MHTYNTYKYMYINTRTVSVMPFRFIEFIKQTFSGIIMYIYDFS